MNRDNSSLHISGAGFFVNTIGALWDFGFQGLNYIYCILDFPFPIILYALHFSNFDQG